MASARTLGWTLEDRRSGRWLRPVVSAGVLIGLAWLLDIDQVAARLGGMRAGWVALAVALSVLQVGASAWRWRFTAARLGIDLPLGAAIREYYLATFLNQVLPGGGLGDVSRAWRHARGARRPGSAVRAVILERVSGQLIMTAAAAGSAVRLSCELGAARRLGWPGGAPLSGAALAAAAIVAVTAAAAGLAAGRAAFRRISADSLAGRTWRDARAALLSRRALPVQAASSALIVASYLATFVLGARAVGVGTPLPTLLPLVAPVLVAMLPPISVAGWGVREGAAAALWAAAGLAAADGVAARRLRYHAPRVAGSASGLTRTARNASNGSGPKRARAREIDDFPDTRNAAESDDTQRSPSSKQRSTSRADTDRNSPRATT